MTRAGQQRRVGIAQRGLLALPIEKLSRLALEHRVRAIGLAGAEEPAPGAT